MTILRTRLRSWPRAQSMRQAPVDAAAARADAHTAAPLAELVNTLEFGDQAARVLGAEVFARLAGSDRAAFDRVTFRPRMMVNCLGLDLSVDVLGVNHVAPILVGPIAEQRRFHADAEMATARGAAAAKTAVVVSARASTPFDAIAAATTTPLFLQVFAEDGARAARAAADAAVRAGAKGIFLTVGATDTAPRRAARADWPVLEALAAALPVPVVAKGIDSAAAAAAAIGAGARGLVVSTYGRDEAPGRPAPLDLIASVAEAAGHGVPILADGGFRRGTDVMKALALGARAVLVARPVLWGVSAYGAPGAQAVLEMLQTELARVMACCGAPNLSSVSRALIAVHAPRPRTRA